MFLTLRVRRFRVCRGSVVSSLFRAVPVEGFWVGLWWAGQGAAAKKERMEGMLAMMESKIVTTHNGKPFDLNDVSTAVVEEARPGRSSDGKVRSETLSRPTFETLSVWNGPMASQYVHIVKHVWTPIPTKRKSF